MYSEKKKQKTWNFEKWPFFDQNLSFWPTFFCKYAYFFTYFQIEILVFIPKHEIIAGLKKSGRLVFVRNGLEHKWRRCVEITTKILWKCLNFS